MLIHSTPEIVLFAGDFEHDFIQMPRVAGRGSLTLWVSDEAIAAWRAAPRTTPGGQARYSGSFAQRYVKRHGLAQPFQADFEGLSGYGQDEHLQRVVLPVLTS